MYECANATVPISSHSCISLLSTKRPVPFFVTLVGRKCRQKNRPRLQTNTRVERESFPHVRNTEIRDSRPSSTPASLLRGILRARRVSAIAAIIGLH